MANELYRNYLIISTSTFDSKTHKWTTAPFASWGHGADRKFYRISDSRYQFDTRQEAENFGISILKSWVNFQLEPWTVTQV
jgi:hypothetical protein